MELYYPDEAGFAPTLPTGYTWARRGTRALVLQEGTCGRRVNALGALRIDGPDPQLVFRTTTGKITADVLLDFLCTHIADLPAGRDTLPARPAVRSHPEVAHRGAGQCIRARQPGRQKRTTAPGGHGVTLYYLPPYSPELNRIERVWRSVKHEDIPIRAYPWIQELQATVDQALAHRNAQLRTTEANLRKTA
ncbi:transposase [Kitasatospora sp. NPDC051914]|uniref:transposase n=1 Tax=Kitasatospora sp. NPDC051914 TaxID=3154945 RepID=UPI00341DCE4F